MGNFSEPVFPAAFSGGAHSDPANLAVLTVFPVCFLCTGHTHYLPNPPTVTGIGSVISPLQRKKLMLKVFKSLT